MSIAVISLSDVSYLPVAALSFPNKLAYAGKHGYAFIPGMPVCKSRPPSWSRIPLIVDQLRYHEWVFWTDADSLIMNNDVTLESVLGSFTEDMIVSNDQNGFNCGNFLIRNSAWSRAFLNEVWKQEQFIHHGCWEQAAMSHVLGCGLNKHLKIIPQSLINSYPNSYKKGDFIVHFAGVRDVGKLVATMERWCD